MSFNLPEPIARFQRELALAESSQTREHAIRCALATASANGVPSVRFVLCKQVDAKGFIFFTNEKSRKGLELDSNPVAALCFHWWSTGVQVRVEGEVSKMDDAGSDAYFATRSRGSQLGAWASRQSSVISGREELEKQVRKVAAQYEGESVPRPPHWVGYRVAAKVVEFWADRPDRLHERTRYRLDNDVYVLETLAP
ncbi:MAG: pyridoxamine 5'-phosphate oxidase [Myxococcota bacterium]